ncbi:hypothetical protein WMY93_011919 [Mugilogobius chulae]|uniref:Uncharacterized protein n=1 Tax=Mugilogobius chulae TaxID=88201 RepID=A0AAW0PA43_9GOBI
MCGATGERRAPAHLIDERDRLVLPSATSVIGRGEREEREERERRICTRVIGRVRDGIEEEKKRKRESHQVSDDGLKERERIPRRELEILHQVWTTREERERLEREREDCFLHLHQVIDDVR